MSLSILLNYYLYYTPRPVYLALFSIFRLTFYLRPIFMFFYLHAFLKPSFLLLHILLLPLSIYLSLHLPFFLCLSPLSLSLSVSLSLSLSLSLLVSLSLPFTLYLSLSPSHTHTHACTYIYAHICTFCLFFQADELLSMVRDDRVPPLSYRAGWCCHSAY